MRVDRARPSDADAIRELSGAIGLTVDVDGELRRPFSRIWLARAEPDGPPIALLVAWTVMDELHIQDVGTLPAARRHGAARLLLGRALAEACRSGATCALLEVGKSNHGARRLYEAAGFVGVRVRDRYYADGEDALEMKCNLHPSPGRPRAVMRAEAR